MRQLWYRIAFAPLRVLAAISLGGIALALALILAGLFLYRPATAAMATMPTSSDASAPRPADFTPVVSPPPAFAASPTVMVLPTMTLSPTLVALTVTVTSGVSVASPTATIPPTATPAVPALETLLEEEGADSDLLASSLVTILLLGKDARPDEPGPSRTDTLMVAVLNLEVPSLTLISIPRDLWVLIPGGYGEGRINTAHFLGEAYEGDGPGVARRTVSQLLNLPIQHTIVVDFDGFRRLIDAMGGVDIDVPQPIDDSLFPDDFYGTYRLVIPAGPQHMDGDRALAYARTRHGNSDLDRAARQQAVMEAARDRLLQPDQLPRLPSYLQLGAEEVETTLSLPDLFFLARFARSVDDAHIFHYVIEPPLLWNGVLGDGAQVLLYDAFTLQSTVQQWLYQAAQPGIGDP